MGYGVYLLKFEKDVHAINCVVCGLEFTQSTAKCQPKQIENRLICFFSNRKSLLMMTIMTVAFCKETSNILLGTKFFVCIYYISMLGARLMPYRLCEAFLSATENAAHRTYIVTANRKRTSHHSKLMRC